MKKALLKNSDQTKQFNICSSRLLLIKFQKHWFKIKKPK